MEEEGEGEDGPCYPCVEEDEEDPYSHPYEGDGDNLSFAETRSLRDDYCFPTSWQGKFTVV